MTSEKFTLYGRERNCLIKSLGLKLYSLPRYAELIVTRNVMLEPDNFPF